MLLDRKGQGYTEYVVMIGGVMIVAGVVMQMFGAVKHIFQRATSRLKDIGSGW